MDNQYKINSLPEYNSVIEENLNHFINLKESPGYALFINGSWGTGKTWFIKNFIKKSTPENFVYISLYGIKNIRDLENQLLQVLYPKMYSDIAKKSQNGLKALLGFWNSSLDHLDIRDYLKIETQKVLIFDDLERCLILNEALGFINKFIEHLGNKVIIIGDEKNAVDFSLQKEKTIGRSFTFSPDFDKAFDFFSSSKDCQEVRSLLQENILIIKNCFIRSNCKNLRTLRYSIIEFQRLFNLLPDKAKQHQNFISTTINTFFSLCIEIKSGNLIGSDLPSLRDAYASKKAENNNEESSEQKIKNKLVEIRKRHFGDITIEIEPNLELFYYFFEHGVAPTELISNTVNYSSYFVEENTPSWVKLWHIHSITEQDFLNLFKEVKKDFEEFKFTKVGELRHVVGMLLNYCKKEYVGINYDDIYRICNDTIEQMSKDGLILNDSDLNNAINNIFDDAAYGRQFQSLSEEGFITLSDLIKNGAKTKIAQEYQEIAKKIPQLLLEDTNQFIQLISPYEKNEKFLKQPFMQYVDVIEFTNSIIKMNPADLARLKAISALKFRYNYFFPNQEVESIEWLEEFKIELSKRIVNLKQPTKFQIEMLLGELERRN